MAILKQATPHQRNALSENSAAQNCGIQFTAVGDDWAEAVMPHVTYASDKPCRVM